MIKNVFYFIILHYFEILLNLLIISYWSNLRLSWLIQLYSHFILAKLLLLTNIPHTSNYTVVTWSLLIFKLLHIFTILSFNVYLLFIIKFVIDIFIVCVIQLFITKQKLVSEQLFTNLYSKFIYISYIIIIYSFTCHL